MNMMSDASQESKQLPKTSVAEPSTISLEDTEAKPPKIKIEETDAENKKKTETIARLEAEIDVKEREFQMLATLTQGLGRSWLAQRGVPF
ncbi:hypothetical protein BKA81DRAFT_435786 [Phyllosticta paracitricarpa]